MKPTELPVPRQLLEAMEDDQSAPCIGCPSARHVTEGVEREWRYLYCKKDWLPDRVTRASLTNAGSKFGSSIRRAARLCPYQRGPFRCYLVLAYVVSSEEPERLQRRLGLSLQSIPFATHVVSTLEELG